MVEAIFLRRITRLGCSCNFYCLEASIQISEKESTDAISIDIRHKDVADIPMYYFPFKLLAEGKVKFGEAFAVKR